MYIKWYPKAAQPIASNTDLTINGVFSFAIPHHNKRGKNTNR
jgi:hypothetical protein